MRWAGFALIAGVFPLMLGLGKPLLGRQVEVHRPRLIVPRAALLAAALRAHTRDTRPILFSTASRDGAALVPSSA